MSGRCRCLGLSAGRVYIQPDPTAFARTLPSEMSEAFDDEALIPRAGRADSRLTRRLISAVPAVAFYSSSTGSFHSDARALEPLTSDSCKSLLTVFSTIAQRESVLPPTKGTIDASPSFVFFSFFYLFFFLIILTLCVAIVRQARAFARRGPSRLLLTFPRLTLARVGLTHVHSLRMARQRFSFSFLIVDVARTFISGRSAKQFLAPMACSTQRSERTHVPALSVLFLLRAPRLDDVERAGAAATAV